MEKPHNRGVDSCSGKLNMPSGKKARGNVGGCGRDLAGSIGVRIKRHKTGNTLWASNLHLSIKETDKYGRSCAKIFLYIIRDSSNWK